MCVCMRESAGGGLLMLLKGRVYICLCAIKSFVHIFSQMGMQKNEKTIYTSCYLLWCHHLVIACIINRTIAFLPLTTFRVQLDLIFMFLQSHLKAERPWTCFGLLMGLWHRDLDGAHGWGRGDQQRPGDALLLWGIYELSHLMNPQGELVGKWDNRA